MTPEVIKPAVRTEKITYAIRDILLVADEVAKTGKEMLYLNIGDPNIYDFEPPRHLIEASMMRCYGTKTVMLLLRE
jgi:alanine-synthesizing transaminase